MNTPTDSRFWNRIAAGYATKPVKDEAAYQRKLELTREYLCDSAQVLEFACGTGTTALLQAPYTQHIDAIDFSEAMIDIARGKAADQGIENVDFHLSSIETWDTPDGSYDTVMAHSILHLLRDKDAVIEKVFRLLKPGGVFVSNTACIDDIFPLFKLIGPIGRFFGMLPYLDVFSAEDLKTSLKSAGFTIEREWQPKKRSALFLIARKPAPTDRT